MRRFYLYTLSALIALVPLLTLAKYKLRNTQIEDFELAMQGPVSRAVFLFKDSSYLNTTSINPPPLEKLSEIAFTPLHYLFQGKYVKSSSQTKEANFQPVFNYQQPSATKTWLSVLALPASVLSGSALKGLALALHKETRDSYQLAINAFESKEPPKKPNYPIQKVLGLAPYSNAPASCLKLPRGPLVHPKIKDDLEALKAISHSLRAYNIPFWLDDGTCLGAYRHSGVIAWDHDIDMGILKADFENAKKALSSLDRSLYEVQDWSGDNRPMTYLRVLVKSNSSLIDIYTYDVHTKTSEVQYIYSLEDSFFVPEKWKDRERRLTDPKPAKWLFPLKEISFDGVQVFVPNEIEKWLQSKYGPDISPAKVWNEELKDYVKVEGHPYWKTNTI